MPDPKRSPHPAKVGPARSAQPSMGRGHPPHPATLQRHERPGAAPPLPATVQRHERLRAVPPHPATVQRMAAKAAGLPVNPPHPATVQRHERPGALPPHPATVQGNERPGAVPPHPATVQRHERPGAVPPHPAMVQRKAAQPASQAAKPPHPATVQRHERPGAVPPHPATVQRMAAEAANLPDKPPHPATVQWHERPGALPPHPAKVVPALGPARGVTAQRAMGSEAEEVWTVESTRPEDVAHSTIAKCLWRISRHLDRHLRSLGEVPQETQAMYVRECVVVTCNNGDATTRLYQELTAQNTDAADLRKAVGYLWPERIGGSPPVAILNAFSPRAAATLLASQNTAAGSLIILAGQQAMQEARRHAEQNLLLALCVLLRDRPDVVSQMVHVYGVKRPCSACLGVLEAFEDALDRYYDSALYYNGKMGRQVVVGNGNEQISQLELPNDIANIAQLPNASQDAAGTFELLMCDLYTTRLNDADQDLEDAKLGLSGGGLA